MTPLKVVSNTFLLALLFLLLNDQTNAQDEFQSPCPRLFEYKGKSNEPDKWYGVITLLSESDLSGISLQVIFDKPALQLGNWFSDVVSTDNKEYLFQNHKFNLKAHVPQTIRFFLQYNTSEPAPKLMSFRLNDKMVCPEGAVTDGEGNEGADRNGNGRPSGGDSNHTPVPQNRPDNTDLNGICGTVVPQPRPLAANGEATHEGEFPWHAALYQAKGINLTYICGASLVSSYHVITTAHCVTLKKSKIPLKLDNLIVYLGQYNLKQFSSRGVQERKVAEITPHPLYDPHNYNNNIALVKFTKPAEFTDYVRPVCLWQESPEVTTVLNKQGTVVGWGLNETGKLAEQLLEMKMPVVSQETCVLSFPNFYSRFTSNNTYCAGFRNRTSVCDKYSRGGMVFPKRDSNGNSPVWQLRGLVSFSIALQNQSRCDKSNYVVFTDTAKYLDWIKTIMEIN